MQSHRRGRAPTVQLGAGLRLLSSPDYASPSGNATRGGEVPLSALPQMLEAAVKSGYLKR